MPPIRGKILSSPISMEKIKKASPIAAKLTEAMMPTTKTDQPIPHVIIIARAGTGKTTTYIEVLKKLYGIPISIIPSSQQEDIFAAIMLGEIPRSACLTSFSNTIVDELKERVPQGKGCQAKTLHGMGYYAVRKAFKITGDPNDGRTNEIVSELLCTDLRSLRKDKNILLKATKELVGLCKQNLVGLNNYTRLGVTDEEEIYSKLDELIRHYEIDVGEYREQIYDLVPRVLERCKDVDRDGYVDFNDMIWLPVILKLPIWVNDLILVDEAQDLNRCQQALAKMSARRLVFCGDDRQAIYGFAGADSESLSRLEKELSYSKRGCVQKKLTVTRRCCKAVVREAQKYVPDFEAHPDNSEGEVTYAYYPIQTKRGADGRRDSWEMPYEDTYLPLVKDGDMVLCRANAPLVNQCLRFLKKGRKAYVQGRNIADSLVALVDSFEQSNTIDMLRSLADWERVSIAKEQAERNPSENKIQSIMDRADCIRAFVGDFKTTEEVKRKIQSVFTDDKQSAGIKFSSIHKAKGLEAKRVFYIQGFGRPRDKMSDWENIQEDNLCYVAITRAKEYLCYVVDNGGEPLEDEEQEVECITPLPLSYAKEEIGEVKTEIPEWYLGVLETLQTFEAPIEIRLQIRKICETYIQGEGL